MPRPRRSPTFRRLAAVGFAVVPVVLVLASPVAAEPLPKTVLHLAGERQRGSLWSSTDANGDGDTCSVGHGDGVPIPPWRAIRVEPGRFRGRIVLRRDDRPRRVTLKAYTETDDSGAVSGPREDVEWRLRARRRGEERRWTIRLRSIVEDHLYLRLGAGWRDPSGCGGDHGSWLFHIRARP